MIKRAQPPDQANAIELKPSADSNLHRLICLVQGPHIALSRAETEAFVLRQVGRIGGFAKVLQLAWRGVEVARQIG